MDDDKELPMHTTVTLGLHPQQFQFEELDDATRPFVQPAIAAFSLAVTGLHAVHEARDVASRNPSLNESAVTLQVAAYADKRMAEITRAIDRASDTLKSQIAHTEQELQKPLEATVHTNTSAELRQLVRAMTAGERRKLVTDSIAANDMTVLSSVLAAHPLLSGLTVLERDQYTRLYREKTQPGLAKRLAC
jgi:hypothetical protein